MIRTAGRRHLAGFALTAGLTAGLVTLAATTCSTGTALAHIPALAAVGTVREANAPRAIPGSYIVVLKPGSTAANQVTSASQALVKKYGGVVVSNYIATVRGFHALMNATQARRLASDAAVSYVEQDGEVSASAPAKPPAPWGLDRIDQQSPRLSGAYTAGSASAVTTYVIDTGIRISHRDFGGRASYGWDFVDHDPDAGDCNGHGTHVAGIIGGTEYGVAKDVRLVAVRALDCSGTGSYSAIIAAVDWVTTHAAKPAVANMSVEAPKSTALNDAVTRSIAAGVTYAVAAGNEKKDACPFSPAGSPNAITVGATDQFDKRAPFSNFGRCVDLFAPGVDIISDYYTSDTAAAMMSGTSMATPHVAGAAALVLAAHPAWTPAQVAAALVDKAPANVVTSAGTGSPTKLLYMGWLDPIAISGSGPLPAAACPAVTDAPKIKINSKKTVTTSRTITGCPGPGPAGAMVGVHVGGDYRGSLAVTLIDPGGVRYLLKAAVKADHQADVSATYGVDLTKSVRNGVWKLEVTDAYGSTGRLDSWSLEL